MAAGPGTAGRSSNTRQLETANKYTEYGGCGRADYKNLHFQGKDSKTVRAYKVAVEEFRKSCPKKFLNEIGRQDLIDFMGWLRGQPPKLRKDGTPRKPRRSGDPNRTYFNKVNNVVIFLSAHGINRLLKKSEYPKLAEKPVVYYDAEQVKALYAAASNDDERFTLDYFLKSGVRDGEAAHAEYDDVKGGLEAQSFDVVVSALYAWDVRYRSGARASASPARHAYLDYFWIHPLGGQRSSPEPRPPRFDPEARYHQRTRPEPSRHPREVGHRGASGASINSR